MINQMPHIKTPDSVTPTVARMTWKVVPLSAGQRLDVRPKDLINDGLFRRCSTYRGGGGYDEFPRIAARRFGGHPDEYSEQFVVQLKGCNLDCPYCYVTRAGVWGPHRTITTSQLVDAFVESGLPVFHLMGGAPALQMRQWPRLIDYLQYKCPDAVFHSDLMLTEGCYDVSTLTDLSSRQRCLYAVNVKGTTPEEWFANTRKPLDEELFWSNWRAIQHAGLPAYVTFTAVVRDTLNAFWIRARHNDIDVDLWRRDHFVIDLIDYDATPHVDDVNWGLASLNQGAD